MPNNISTFVSSDHGFAPQFLAIDYVAANSPVGPVVEGRIVGP